MCFRDLAIFDTKDEISFLFQDLVAFLVVPLTIRTLVWRAIQFDGELCAVLGEVENKSSEGNLAAEIVSITIEFAQRVPQALFECRRSGAHLSCIRKRGSLDAIAHAYPPPDAFRFAQCVDLPTRGRFSLTSNPLALCRRQQAAQAASMARTHRPSHRARRSSCRALRQGRPCRHRTSGRRDKRASHSR